LTKIVEKIVDYLGCHNVESEREKKIVMFQPHLIEWLIQNFEKKIEKRIHKPPGIAFISTLLSIG
jgi:hypothetical protein